MWVHLTFNQVVAGSIPARPTNKSITIPRECDSNGLEGIAVGHIRVTLP